MKNERYAGVGSRQTAKVIFRLQVRIGMALCAIGAKLESGAAHGSDEAYELGVDLASQYLVSRGIEDSKAIYIPWEGFRARKTSEPGVIIPKTSEAMSLTSKYHAAWDNLSIHVKRLMSRNALQILGQSLKEPVSRVMCYTADGAQTAQETSSKTGGTGQAIRIASDYGVPVVNIGNPQQRAVVIEWLARFDDQLHEKGLPTTESLVNGYLDQYMGFPCVEGDLIALADEGAFDVIIHGCNCQNAMGEGFAKHLVSRWPEALEADRRTVKGDKDKLGDYTSIMVDTHAGMNALQIVNGYTQYYWGRDPETCYVDYESLRKLFIKLNRALSGKRIGIPMIGAGLANGEWYVIDRLIHESAPDLDITVITLA